MLQAAAQLIRSEFHMPLLVIMIHAAAVSATAVLMRPAPISMTTATAATAATIASTQHVFPGPLCPRVLGEAPWEVWEALQLVGRGDLEDAVLVDGGLSIRLAALTSRRAP